MRLLTIALLLSLSLVPTFAQTGQKTIWDTLQANSSFSSFVSAARSFNPLVQRLNNSGTQSTLFVPTNTAIRSFDLKNYAYSELQILDYHVAMGSFALNNFTDGQLLPSLLTLPSLGGAPQQLKIIVAKGGILVNNNKIMQAVSASNGQIYVIEQILLPPLNATDVIPNYGFFRNISNLISKLGLESVVNNRTTTLLMPVDAAFRNSDPALAGILLLNTNRTLVTRIIQEHVIPGQVLYYDKLIKLTKPQTYMTAGQRPLTFDVLNENSSSMNSTDNMFVRINNTALMYQNPQYHDILSSGGVLHGINRVLVPKDIEFTIFDVLRGLEANRFLSFLEKSGLNNSFVNSRANYTLFVPTDDAIGNQSFNRSDVLNYVARGTYFVSDGLQINNLAGNTWLLNSEPRMALQTITVEGTQYFATILRTSFLASNAVIYLIDRVLGIPM